jgi:low affinity Fe/Cu permease
MPRAEWYQRRTERNPATAPFERRSTPLVPEPELMATPHGKEALSRTSFDRFAERASDIVSEAAFFIACVALVVVWVPSIVVIRNVDTWQLLINTATTIVTFLLVALLQNSQRRSEIAMHQKLDALADGLADLMEGIEPDNERLQNDMRELRAAVGIERAD